MGTGPYTSQLTVLWYTAYSNKADGTLVDHRDPGPLRASIPSLGRELAAGLDVRLPRSMERRMALGPVARSDHEVDDHSTGFSYHEEAVLIIGATTHLPRHTDHRHFYMPFGLRSGLGGVGERRPRPAVRFSGQGDVLGL